MPEADHQNQKYESTLESVRKHEVPKWFHDAKFGIFIHWNLSCVPAFAPTDHRDIVQIIKEDGYKEQFKNNPYADWYLNSLRIKDSPAQKFHHKTYGRDYPYDHFADEFNKGIQSWNPGQWADIFSQACARYVVLVTKHHDGFLLWPSDTPHPVKKNFHASRDVVGELTSAVKTRGMRMGFYYSGALDWSFNKNPITDVSSFIINGPVAPVYVDYVDHHFRELIDKYEPAILWNDIGYPPGTNLYDLFAYFYNKISDGVVNDRWIQIPKKRRWIYTLWPVRKFLEIMIAKAIEKEGIKPVKPPHFDYQTPEYTTLSTISETKWECVRGIGTSFGYNRFETPDHYIKSDELIRMLVDIVSKNGNLLLNVGPMSDGTLPDIQVDRLKHLGNWLGVNGKAVFDTRPWMRAEGQTQCRVDIRFTQKQGQLFAILMATPKGDHVIVKDLKIPAASEIAYLGLAGALEWRQLGGDIHVALPEKLIDQPAHVLNFSNMV